MKVLVTGMNGQVGQAVCAMLRHEGIECQGLSAEDLDITRDHRVQRALRKSKPDFVVNAAAYTAVDAAEDDTDRCFAVNRDGVHHLATACKKHGIPLIHISTDYVFDGQKSAAYVEADKANPINVYGDSKFQGEEVLRETLPEHIVLRVSWVFSEWRNNFVKTMMRLGLERETLQIVDDQVGAPTSAYDIARVIVAIIKQLDCGVQAWGTYHYCGAEVTNWFEFAKAIIAETGKYCSVKVGDISAMKTQDYSYRAPRQHNSQLDCHKILETFGIHQHAWRPEMERIVKKLCEESRKEVEADT